MADDVELATAWVRLVPSVSGITDSVTDAFAPAEGIGAQSGQKAGAAWAGKLKGALGAAAIGTAVVASFKGLYEVGSIFDDVTDTIRVGTGAQGEALDGLVQVAKNVGTSVPASFDQIGSTVADLNTRLGLSGETLTTVSAQYLEAGRILGEDVDINSSTAAFNAFGIAGDDVSAAMDSLFQVSQATGVGINDLTGGIGKAAPALQNLGFGFEDSIALLGSLDKAGLNSQQVMGSLSKGLVTLAKDGEDPAAAFQRVTGELQGFVDKGDSAAALDLAGKIFGTRGASQFVGALQSGVLSMDDLMAATGATSDTILGVASETADAAEQWQMLKNKALKALEPIGTAVFNLVGRGLGMLNDLTEDLDFSQFAELLGYLSPLGVIFKILQPLLPQIAQALGPALSSVISALLPVLQTVVGLFSGLVADVLPPLLPIIVQLADMIGMVLMAITPLLPPLMQLIEAVLPIITVAFQALIGVVGGFVNAVQSLLIPIVDMLVAVLTGVIDFLTGVFTGDWEKAWQGIVEIFSGLWNGLADIGKGVINALIDIINGFTAGLNEVGSFVKDVTGGAIDFTIGKIPHLALGATVLPRPGGTLAVLAEAGRPESVVDTGLLNRALEVGIEGRRTGGDLIQNNNFAHLPPEVAVEMAGQRFASAAARGRA